MRLESTCNRVFMLVFGIGAMAAGFAGIVNAPIAPISPGSGDDILVQAFVVVVIGGVGSFPGAIVGGLIAGEIVSITSMINPAYSQVMLFAVMALVLVFRPRGLLGVTRAGMMRPAPLRFSEELDSRCCTGRGIGDRPRSILPRLGFAQDTINLVLVFGLFGIGFDLLFGYTGLLSFGQAAFFGTGGFVAAYLLVNLNFPSVTLALLIGTVAAAVVGAALAGLVALRRTGIYFAMITVAIAEMFFFLENSPLSSVHRRRKRTGRGSRADLLFWVRNRARRSWMDHVCLSGGVLLLWHGARKTHRQIVGRTRLRGDSGQSIAGRRGRP